MLFKHQYIKYLISLQRVEHVRHSATLHIAQLQRTPHTVQLIVTVSDTCNSPSLKEIDIVELVEFDGELEGGLQVGHGWSGSARARAARRAMPRPLAGRRRPGPRGAGGAHRRYMHALHGHETTPRYARCSAGRGPLARDTRLRRACGPQCGKREFILSTAVRMRAAPSPCRARACQYRTVQVRPPCRRAVTPRRAVRHFPPPLKGQGVADCRRPSDDNLCEHSTRV